MSAIEEAIQALKSFERHIRHQTQAELHALHTAHANLQNGNAQTAAAAQHASSIAEQAANTAQHAGSIAGQASASVQHMEAQLKEMWASLHEHQRIALEASQRTDALLNSTSWRATAPLRWLRITIKQALSTPWRAVRFCIRKTLLPIMGFVLARPSLRNFFSSGLKKFPAIAHHLHLLAIHRGLISPQEGSIENRSIEEPPTEENCNLSFKEFIALNISMQNESAAQFSFIAKHAPAASKEMLAKVAQKSSIDLDPDLIEAIRRNKAKILNIPANKMISHLEKLIDHIYIAILRRYPDDPSKLANASALAAGASIHSIIENLKKSEEFRKNGYRDTIT